VQLSRYDNEGFRGGDLKPATTGGEKEDESKDGSKYLQEPYAATRRAILRRRIAESRKDA
jgi:hypothetical protein